MNPANGNSDPTIVVHGPTRLSGAVRIQPSKNAAQKVLPATVLFPGRYRVENLPQIADAAVLMDVLRYLNAEVRIEGDSAYVNTERLVNRDIPRDLSVLSTGTFLFAGALLGRFGRARVAHPGGDAIGTRRVDLHLDAFRAVGAEVSERNGYYNIGTASLRGAQFRFKGRTVNGTVNAILAAARAPGTTMIDNGAYDPDIANVIEFLNTIGARVVFEDTVAGRIRVVGSANGAGGGGARIITDRNDTATFAVAAALCRSEVQLVGVAHEEIEPLCDLLAETGATATEGQYNGSTTLTVKGHEPRPLRAPVVSQRYPGISTDWGPLIQVLMTQIPGESTFEETVYSNRFAHAPELVKLGAKIRLVDPGSRESIGGAEFNPEATYTQARIQGPTDLHGRAVTANDVRAGAALVLAGLVSEGMTTVSGVSQVERGYQRFVERLQSIGANVQRRVTA